MVYPGSPAAAAGIGVGDRIIKIADTQVDSIQAAIGAMNSVLPGAAVAVRVLRDDKPVDMTIEAGQLPTNIVAELPPAYPAPAQGTDKAQDATAEPKVQTQELKLAEFSETCRVYVPPLAAGQTAGVLLWLHAPGDPPTDELFHQWQAICDRDGLILVAPSATDPSRWERTELEYLRRLSERVLAEYPVDPRRVVVFGPEGGGAMAYLTALVSRELFTGVATTAAALPRTVDPPGAQPTTRLAVFSGLPANPGRAAQMQIGLQKLRDAGYPVTLMTMSRADGRLSAEEREELARWIDSLDRF